MEKSKRESSGVRNSGAGSRDQVHAMEPGMLEHSLYKREGGGSSPSPATNFKKFGIRWAEPVGLPECPYLTRWVLTLAGYSIRLHWWRASDDQRHPHDHTWDYMAVILWGRYRETTVTTAGFKFDLRTVGSITRYKAEHRHMVQILPGESCLSLLFTGKPRRQWGFYVLGRDKLMRPLRYFNRYGHHPCD